MRAGGLIGRSSAKGHFGATFADATGTAFNDFPGAKDANGRAFEESAAALRVAFVLNWDDWKRPHVNHDLFVFDSNG